MSTCYELKNEKIKIEVSSFGAQLQSLQDVATNKEYMWNGNPEFWGRISPILFPIVGSLRNKEFHVDGQAYPMSQHGFARDMEFELLECKETFISFTLKSNEETIKMYPYHFELIISYELIEKDVKVTWIVKNIDTKEIYFSIGGHPAFLCPIEEGKNQTDYFIHFDKEDKIDSTIIKNSGLISDELKTYHLNNGLLPITKDLFEKDALVVEHHQVHNVSLVNEKKEKYLTVSFDAPLFGVWAPKKENVPFICIEPWYGRCDGEHFLGEFKDRNWTNTLGVKELFKESYTIRIY